MKKIVLTLMCLLLVTGALTIIAAAQEKRAAVYKLTGIKIIPFEKKTGEFEKEITETDDRSFFNEISKTYLVIVEVTGETGSFEVGRKIEIVVTENGKVKTRKLEQIDLIGDGGKVYMPLWIDAPLCARTVISARVIGQKTISSLKRSFIVFQCGE